MNSLFILLFAFFANFGIENNSALLHTDDCPPPEIENVMFTWEPDCQGVTYTIVVCNNSLCTTSATTLNLAFLPVPKDDMFIQHSVGQLLPQTCTSFSGYIRATNNVNVHAGIEGAPESDIYFSKSKC